MLVVVLITLCDSALSSSGVIGGEDDASIGQIGTVRAERDAAGGEACSDHLRPGSLLDARPLTGVVFCIDRHVKTLEGIAQTAVGHAQGDLHHVAVAFHLAQVHQLDGRIDQPCALPQARRGADTVEVVVVGPVAAHIGGWPESP